MKRVEKLLCVIMVLVLTLSLFGCDNNENLLLSREEAFTKIVQNMVSKYGLMTRDKTEPYRSVAYDNDAETELKNRVKGLSEAQLVDITGDGEDELFCVWYDQGIQVAVYEYKKGQAKKVWSDETGDILGVCSLDLYRKGDRVLWRYSTTRHAVGNIVSYVDGKYIDISDFEDDFTEEEQEYLNQSGHYYSFDEIKKIYEKRFGIENPDEEETSTLYSYHVEFYDLPYVHEDFLDRWNVTVPEPKLSPLDILNKLPYFGEKSNCVMTKEMAVAFAEVLNNIPSLYNNSGSYTLRTYLVDWAGDGMPVLVTAYTDGKIIASPDNQPMLDIWTWNGQSAERVDMRSRNKLNRNPRTVFMAKLNGKPVFMLDYTSSNAGYSNRADGWLIYSVENGQLAFMHDEMQCYASGIGADIVYGDYIPVNGEVYGEYVNNDIGIPAQELLDEGWYVSGIGMQSVSALARGIFLDGKIIPYTEGEGWKGSVVNSVNVNYQSDQIMEGQIDFYITDNWGRGEETSENLIAYSKVAGRPSYSYSEVSASFTEEQISAIANTVANLVKGTIGDIYKISDDLYYIIIYVNDEVSGGVLVKNTGNGSSWRVISHSEKLLSASDLQTEINNDNSVSNITVDYSKTDKKGDYLREILKNIDGTVPNDTAKSEINSYIQNTVSKNSEVKVSAKGNKITINEKTVADSIKKATETKDNLEQILDENDVSLNKTVTVIIHIICNKTDIDKDVQITFDSEVCDALANADAAKLIFGDYSITVTKYALENAINKYGNITVSIKRTGENVYYIQFTDANGNKINKLDNGISFELPSINEHSNITVEYIGGSDSWAGQYDASKNTIIFDSQYSGSYTVVDNTKTVSDIEGLSPEQQKAIKFMVSKEIFSMDGENFYPQNPLTRYQFTEALVRMFFALDRELTTTFTDVPVDSPYYDFVASMETLDILKGYEDGTFRGDNEVLRQEVLAICSRTLANKKGYIIPENPDEYLDFADKSSIEQWAKPEIALTVRETLISEGGYLYPEQSISRADSALILYRLFMLLYEVEPTATQTTSYVLPIVLGSVCGICVIAIVVLLILKKKKFKMK